MNKEQTAFEVFQKNLDFVLRGNNKLTLVFVSLAIILIGIVMYLVYNETRIKRLENKIKDK
jgi:hypothetical protein